MLFSVHLKATMMKVSDPIMFGHAVQHLLRRRVRAVRRGPRRGRRRPQRRPGQRAHRAREAAGRQARRPSRTRSPRPTTTGPSLAMVDSDKRHHQPARAQRRDHRRVDAGGDPLVGPDVERRRRAAGHQVRHPGLVLRRALRRDGRPLPEHGAFDPATMGTDAQRRPDGAEGRGVRQPRQDVRDRRRGTVRVVDGAGATLLEHEVEPRRHLARAARPRTRRSATG